RILIGALSALVVLTTIVAADEAKTACPKSTSACCDKTACATAKKACSQCQKVACAAGAKADCPACGKSPGTACASGACGSCANNACAARESNECVLCGAKKAACGDCNQKSACRSACQTCCCTTGAAEVATKIDHLQHAAAHLLAVGMACEARPIQE